MPAPVAYNRRMDHALVERAQRGDERAFEALTVSSHARSFAIAFGILRDARRAEEATQHAFLETWRALPRLHDLSHFSGWSTRHLVEACRTEAASMEPVTDDEDGASASWSASTYPLGMVFERDRLASAFDGLAFDERAALVLRYFADLSPEAIALALGLKPAVAQGRIAAAMAALEEAIDSEPTLRQGTMVQPEGS